ncbi:MAG: primosomal protein N' [Ectothiorhodospiraceae bacterium]|nr:primosomal protein N' [Ectothiorhodospiraceae bacterium]
MADDRIYVDVAIAGIPFSSLTYSVPEHLRNNTSIGKRAVVSIGKRIANGFIIDRHSTPPSQSAKPILEILDAKPVVTPALITLCKWMAQYYYCPLGDALKTSLPQGVDVEGERMVSLRNSDPALLKKAIGKSGVKGSIVDALLTGEVLSERDLLYLSGAASIAPQLRDLAGVGIIEIETILKPPAVKIKMQNVVRLQSDWQQYERLEELMQTLERRAPKQANVVALLYNAHKQGRKTMSMPELTESAGASSAQVRALEKKDIVDVFEEEVVREAQYSFEEHDKEFVLTQAQQDALGIVTSQIDSGKFHTNLLYGVPGSGKTQVYIEAVRHARDEGKNALVLVPEISLTPQVVYRFRKAFGKQLTVIHSGLSLGERYDAWRKCVDGEYRVVVGVRSASMVPIDNLGLIVVDEEHEASYKQSDMQPRYHARDVAVMRGFIEQATVLLGSATPSAETYNNAKSGKYNLLELNERVPGAELPSIRIVDMAEERRMLANKGEYSSELLAKLESTIAEGNGAIVFQNRRGYAPQMHCRECGHVEQCVNCSISLTYHKDSNNLRCHYCGYTRSLLKVCSECGSPDLKMMGFGTQKLEEELAALLPDAKIIRMDLDTTRRKGSHDFMLSAFTAGDADILLGTQMVAKGLDFERVSLVGVISAEHSLFMPDFRAEERTFQLLTQVAGRAGRGKHRGTVLFQTAKAEHPLFHYILKQDYRSFIEVELERRKSLSYSPFTRMALITFSGEDERKTAAAAETYFDLLTDHQTYFNLYPAQPAILERVNKQYRYQILLRIFKQRDADGAKMKTIFDSVRERYSKSGASSKVRITIDIDPQDMF